MSAKTKSVVMLTSTHNTVLGDVVKVSTEDAERLLANGHAREPRAGEVKAAASES